MSIVELFQEIHSRRIDEIRNLIEGDRDIINKMDKGHTPLTRAILLEDRDEISLNIIKYLLEVGANPIKSNKQKQTPLQLVKKVKKSIESLNRSLKRHRKSKNYIENAEKSKEYFENVEELILLSISKKLLAFAKVETNSLSTDLEETIAELIWQKAGK